MNEPEFAWRTAAADYMEKVIAGLIPTDSKAELAPVEAAYLAWRNTQREETA